MTVNHEAHGEIHDLGHRHFSISLTKLHGKWVQRTCCIDCKYVTYESIPVPYIVGIPKIKVVAPPTI